ncbi:MAG TPA: DNA N-6-adenine-methyltransferase [Nitrosarchaeum sp.]
MTNDNWETPDWLIEHFKGNFDPCPNLYLPNSSTDGLLMDWSNPTYVNPPYSNPLPWVEKAIEQSKRGVKVCMLLRCDPSTKWYRLLIEHGAKIAFFNPRFKFKNAIGSPNFAVMLAFL